ncbi:MAG: HPr family phosphocarrier protein [Alphaproteobacteria bacterium]
MQPIDRVLVLQNRKGLHARAAAKFVKIVGQFQADVNVTKEGITVPGESIMGLMMLAANQGSKISVTASGQDAEPLLDALEDLLERKFDEEPKS